MDIGRSIPAPPQVLRGDHFDNVEKPDVGLVRVALATLHSEVASLEVVRDALFEKFGPVIFHKPVAENTVNETPSGSDLGKALNNVSSRIASVCVSLNYAVECCDL